MAPKPNQKAFPISKSRNWRNFDEFPSFRYFSDTLKMAILELKSANGRILFRLTVHFKLQKEKIYGIIKHFLFWKRKTLGCGGNDLSYWAFSNCSFCKHNVSKHSVCKLKLYKFENVWNTSYMWEKGWKNNISGVSNEVLHYIFLYHKKFSSTQFFNI